ncbi:tyrosine-type recombinase/integrase [Streptomyces dysideae]|uniref:tyrosine-type recombinase/integrase n=1 Tax=Streptomyces dysideae TaxID=909626 RepID=UPI000AF3C361|nr:tyrosine-type recombinase/integrase [Streptomyces dysideae]
MDAAGISSFYPEERTVFEEGLRDEEEQAEFVVQRRATPKAFRALQAQERLALGEAYTVSGHVLVHQAGDAFTIKQLSRRAYRLMELLGLRRVRLYDARSPCFTFLANNGVPDHILARWAGHTNIKTTKRWYVKPDAEDLREAATTWDGLHGVAEEGQA